MVVVGEGTSPWAVRAANVEIMGRIFIDGEDLGFGAVPSVFVARLFYELRFPMWWRWPAKKVQNVYEGLFIVRILGYEETTGSLHKGITRIEI